MLTTMYFSQTHTLLSEVHICIKEGSRPLFLTQTTNNKQIHNTKTVHILG